MIKKLHTLTQKYGFKTTYFNTDYGLKATNSNIQIWFKR